MNRRRLGIILVVAGPLVALLLYLWPHSDDPRDSICTFRRVTGLPCATCGMTRALSSLVRGEWRCSYAYHPLGGAVAVLLCIAWAGTAWFWLHNTAVPKRLARWWFLGCLACAAACFIVWISCVILPNLRAIWYH